MFDIAKVIGKVGEAMAEFGGQTKHTADEIANGTRTFEDLDRALGKANKETKALEKNMDAFSRAARRTPTPEGSDERANRLFLMGWWLVRAGITEGVVVFRTVRREIQLGLLEDRDEIAHLLHLLFLVPTLFGSLKSGSRCGRGGSWRR